jgi:hypothetical protein
MRRILVYSSSLTWGILPNTRERLPFDERWPDAPEVKLIPQSQAIRKRTSLVKAFLDWMRSIVTK